MGFGASELSFSPGFTEVFGRRVSGFQRKEVDMIGDETMAKIAAFRELAPSRRRVIQELCEELVFRNGEKLFTEGDEAKHLWVVVNGHVDLRFELPSRRASIDHTVDSVEVQHKVDEAKTLGWSCFVPPYQMRLSAYCVTQACRIVRIRRDDLLQLFDADPKMGYQFLTYLIRVVGYRFHQFQNYVAQHMGEHLLTGW